MTTPEGLSWRRRAAAISLAVAAVPFLLVFTGLVRPAGASPLPAGRTADTTCQTEPYSGGCISTTTTTVAGATTTTAPVSGQVGVVISAYAHGVLTWRACGFPAAAIGTRVQLYVGGIAQTGPGGSAIVGTDGCTPYTNDPICLPAGSYALAAVDQPYGEAIGTLTVTAADACVNAVNVVNGNNGQQGSGGLLPLTGLDALRLVVAALVAVMVGYAVVRIARVRRGSAGTRR